MHIIIATRGIKANVDRFIEELQKIMLPMWMTLPVAPPAQSLTDSPGLSGAQLSGAATQTMMNMAQVAVRPYQIWEVIFPKEYEDLMCATLFDKARGQTHEKWLMKYWYLLRKALHLEPINWDYRAKPEIPIHKDFIEVIGIGKKSDREINTPEGLKHEGL